jgi:hypothetical protein
MFRIPPAGEPSVFPLSRSQDWIRLLCPCSRFPFPSFGVIGEYSQLTANQCQATTEQLNLFPGRPSLTRFFLPQRQTSILGRGALSPVVQVVRGSMRMRSNSPSIICAALLGMVSGAE